MSRHTITLPAPPGKRQKHQQPEFEHQQPAAAEADTLPEEQHPVVAAAVAALPSDTLVALALLKSRFPAQVRPCVCMGGRHRACRQWAPPASPPAPPTQAHPNPHTSPL